MFGMSFFIQLYVTVSDSKDKTYSRRILGKACSVEMLCIPSTQQCFMLVCGVCFFVLISYLFILLSINAKAILLVIMQQDLNQTPFDSNLQPSFSGVLIQEYNNLSLGVILLVFTEQNNSRFSPRNHKLYILSWFWSK